MNEKFLKCEIENNIERATKAHLVKVRKMSDKFPKEFAEFVDYDKEAFGKGIMDLDEAVKILVEEEVPGDMNIIGGLSRRGNTLHDLDVIIDAKDLSLDEVSEKLEKVRLRLASKDLTLDAYVTHKTGFSMGDPRIWGQGTQGYFDALKKNHKLWIYNVPKL